MRSLVLLAIVGALIGLGLYTAPPPTNLVTGDPNPETFAEWTRKRCAVEATEARRLDCFERLILQKAFEQRQRAF